MSKNTDTEIHSYRPPSPFFNFFMMVLAGLVLLFVVVGIVTSWSTVVTFSPLVVVLLAFVAVVAIPIFLFFYLKYQHTIQQLHILSAEEDLREKEAARLRTNELHEATIRVKLTQVLQADALGNRPAVLLPDGNLLIAPSGNMPQVVQPVPHTITYAPHTSYSYKDSSQRMLEEGSDDTSFQKSLAPTIEEVIESLPRNGFQIGLGRSLESGDLLQPIDLPDTHIKLIGASRMGKSCMAAAILEQVQRTHDPNTLQFALLDLEYKTSRLFERSSHIAYIQAGRRGKVPAIARSAEEVALWLRYLREEMDRRYKMPAQQKAQLPYILVYLEEFLDLRRRLKGQALTDALDDFTQLATRSLKERLGLMVCAQVAYSNEELRDAMAQFVGANLSFAVMPSAARAAGFIDTTLLNKNYAAKQPGQFVVEATGVTDIGISPDFNVKQKLAVLDGSAEQVQEPYELLALEPPEMQVQAGADEVQESVSHPPAPTWQAHLDQVWDLYEQGVRNQDQIILKIWNIKKGGNEKWYACRDIVQQCLAAIKQAKEAK